MNIIKYGETIKHWYGDKLSGYQLLHENGDVQFFVVYTVDGHIEIARLFPNYFTQEIDINVERKVTDIDHTLIPLTDLMQIVETVVNTLKGVD